MTVDDPASATVIVTTLPSTTVESPSSLTLCSVHSSDTGESATRGGLTTLLGSIVMPRCAGSLSSKANAAEVLFTASSSGPWARLTTNSPVACTLRSVSLLPTDVNCTIGGLAQATV